VLLVPVLVSQAVDQGQERHLENDRVSQPHHRCHDGVEPSARLLRDQPALQELRDQRPDPHVDDQLGQDQQGQAHQIAHVRFDVANERERRAAEGAPFQDREQEQRHPGDDRDRDDPAMKQLERRARHPQPEE
jgi:hypothetical protein